jgi:hypothetical protein
VDCLIEGVFTLGRSRILLAAAKSIFSHFFALIRQNRMACEEDRRSHLVMSQMQ